jgi:hypothetical protein
VGAAVLMNGDCFIEGRLLEFAESPLLARGSPASCGTSGVIYLTTLGAYQRYTDGFGVPYYLLKAPADGQGKAIFAGVPPTGGWDIWAWDYSGFYGWPYPDQREGKPYGTRWRITMRFETLVPSAPPEGINLRFPLFLYDDTGWFIYDDNPEPQRGPKFTIQGGPPGLGDRAVAVPTWDIPFAGQPGVWEKIIYVNSPKRFCQPQFHWALDYPTGWNVEHGVQLEEPWPSPTRGGDESWGATNQHLFRFDATAVRLDEHWLAVLMISVGTGRAPLTVFLSDITQLDGTIVSRTFNFGDGTFLTTTDAGVSHTYNAPGIYSASLTATDATGRSSTSSPRRIIALVNPDFTWNRITVGTTWRYTFLPVATGTATHVWDFGGFGTSTAQNPTLTTPVGAGLNAKHTVTQNGVTDTLTKNVA